MISQLTVLLWISLILSCLGGCTQSGSSREQQIDEAIAYRDALARLPTDQSAARPPTLRPAASLSIALDQICLGASGPILWHVSMEVIPSSGNWLVVQWVSFLDSPPEIFVYNKDGKMIGYAKSSEVLAGSDSPGGLDRSPSIIRSELLRVLEPDDLSSATEISSDRIIVLSEPLDSAAVVYVRDHGGSGSLFNLIYKSHN